MDGTSETRDRRPTLVQLRALVAVADAGSFGGAAAELGVTQSGLSHAVGALERGLGCALLDRTRRGTVPTEAGSRVAARARRVLDLVDQLPADAAGSDGVGGTVRLACFRSLATHLLPGVVSELARALPGVRLDIDDGCFEREEVERAMLEGRAHLGLAHLPVADRLVSFPLGHDEYVAVVPERAWSPGAASWAELERLPYLQLDCSGAAGVFAACRADGFRATPATRLRGDSSVLATVAQGAGFSILPRLAVEPAPAGIGVQRLPIPATRELGAVVHPDIMRLPAVGAVLKVVRSPKVLATTEAVRRGWLRSAQASSPQLAF